MTDHHNSAEVDLSEERIGAILDVVHHLGPVFNCQRLEHSECGVAEIAEGANSELDAGIIVNSVILQTDPYIDRASAVEIAGANVSTLIFIAANPREFGALRPVGGIDGCWSESAPVVDHA